MTKNIELINEARAWVKRRYGPDEIIRVVPEHQNNSILRYGLYTAFNEHPDHLGTILFDAQGYWIYDGETLTIDEQEQVAKFIIGYVEKM